MKYVLLSIFSFFLTISSFAQKTNPKLDTTLAKNLGADDYGMKHYVFVLLKNGDNKTTNKPFVDSCFAGHMANMDKLVNAKQLIIAGPFMKNESTFRGLFSLNIKSLEEAERVIKTDPAVNAGLLKAELYPWYGSAALSEYLPIHDKIWKSNP